MIEWLGNYWFLLLPMLLPLIIWGYRHERSYRKLLTLELEKYGFEYVSEESLDAFDTGPFPKVEKLSRKKGQARVKFLGIRGNWITYRLVYFYDGNKEECSSWVRIRYDMFSITDVKWNPLLSSFSTNKGKKKH